MLSFFTHLWLMKQIGANLRMIVESTSKPVKLFFASVTTFSRKSSDASCYFSF